MANVVVVGAQWGDEGKGKIVDWLSERADVIARFQGGHNAGHTLVIDGVVYKLSLLPSGIVRGGKLSVIGNGVARGPCIDGRARMAAEQLRHGHVLDADWQGRDRFRKSPDLRTPVPLPGTPGLYSELNHRWPPMKASDETA